MGGYKPETPTITPEEEEKSNVIGGRESIEDEASRDDTREFNGEKVMGQLVPTLPENKETAQSPKSTALRKAIGYFGKADEAYSERMKGRFRRGLLQRG